MFHLVTQWGQIPSWKMKWELSVDGGFHFFFFFGEQLKRKVRGRFLRILWSFGVKAESPWFFFPHPVLTDTHTVSKCITTTTLENKFISAPLRFSWLHTGEEYEHELLGGGNKSTICIRTTLWIWNQLLWCIAWRKAQYHPNSQRIVFVHFHFQPVSLNFLYISHSLSPHCTRIQRSFYANLWRAADTEPRYLNRPTFVEGLVFITFN